MNKKKKMPVVTAAAPSAIPAPARDPLSPVIADSIAVLLLIAATIIFYWPIISLNGSFWNDFIEQYFPYRVFATRALHHGIFPFWNPYSFSGMPFFADIQSAVLYPLNLLLVPFAGKNGVDEVLFEFQIVFHILLAGIFTYALARDFNRSRVASVTAGLVYMLGGFTSTHIFHVTMIHALPWFSLSLLLFRRALDRSSFRYAIATAFSLCCIAFAGHPQMYVYINYLLGAYLLYHLIERFRAGCDLKKAALPVGIFLISVLSGAGLSSVQLLPTSQLSKESIRPELEFDKSTQGSFRPYRFITLLAPNYYGMPNNYRSDPPFYWGTSEKDVDPGVHYYWETALYLGVLPLFFALFALFALRSPPVVFLGALALFTLLIAMGDSAPFYRAAYGLMPGFKLFRNPARIGIIFTLAMALLSAFGIDRFLPRNTPSGPSASGKRKTAIVFGILAGVILLTAIAFTGGLFRPLIVSSIIKSGILGTDSAEIEDYVMFALYPFITLQIWIFAGFALISLGLMTGRLYRFLPARFFSIALPALLFTDLLIFGYGFAAMKNDPHTIYEDNELIRSVKVKTNRELFRINSRGSNPGSDAIGGPFLIFRRNEGTVFEIFLMEGYNPLRLKRQLMDRKAHTLDILNIKYKIHVDEESEEMSIVTHPTYFPRARLVPSYRIITDESKILPTLHDPDFDHVNNVILEEQPHFAPSPSGLQARQAEGTSSATITSYSINRIVTEVSTDQPALLVLSEIYYPAWKATVDGKKADVLRADYALRAIPVPAGNHTVVCFYNDDAFNRGLIITLLTLCASAGIIVFPLLRRRKGWRTGD